MSLSLGRIVVGVVVAVIAIWLFFKLIGALVGFLFGLFTLLLIGAVICALVYFAFMAFRPGRNQGPRSPEI